MTTEKELFDLLWSAIEDDSGLWGFVWELNVTKQMLSTEDRFRIAYEATRELLQRGWVELHERYEWGPDFSVVDKSRFDDILLNRKNWDEPEPECVFYSIEATEAGEQEYFQRAEEVRKSHS